MRCVFASVLLAGVASAFRGDASRSLIEVPLRSKSDVLDILALSGVERDDFEEVHPTFVKMWANVDLMKQLVDNNWTFEPTEDTSEITFQQQKAVNYHDSGDNEPDWGQYCGYSCLVDRLRDLEANCAYPVNLIDMGPSSSSSYRLWALQIGQTGPEVFMAGNIHGDETTGGQLLQRWVWETCNQASSSQAEVATRTQTYYMPMFNPDGFERNRRGNANNRDLNRDFPRPSDSDSPSGREAETSTYMNFVSSHNFVTSMMYHGGAVVVNYPWDNCYTADLVPRPCPGAIVTSNSNPGNWTDAEVVDVSADYGDALNRHANCMTSNCLINGAAWYQITGSVQDYMLYHKGAIDVTLEVSSIKRPPSSQLPNFYTQNVEAMYEYIIWAANNKKM